MSIDIFRPGLSPMSSGLDPARRTNPFARPKAVAAVVALLVAGAVGIAVHDGGSTPVVTTPAAVAPEVVAPAVIRPGEVVGTVGGTWFTYPNGLEVQVAKVAEYALPGQSLQDTAYSTGVLVTVALKNGTGAAFDAQWANVTLKYGPYHQAARPTYDKVQGARLPGMFFAGSVAAGATQTTRFGFSVPVEYLGDLSIELRPGIKTDPAVFGATLAAQATPTATPTPTPVTLDEGFTG